MEELRHLVKEMLKKGIVQGVLAPVRESGNGNVSPCFVTTERDADRIALDSYYPFSLAKLVSKQVGKDTKVGMVGTTCDVQALIELAKREQVVLDKVLVIGVECEEEGFPYPWCRRCEHLVPSMADVAFYQDGTVSANTEKGKELLSLMNASAREKRETPPEAKERALQRQEEDWAKLARLEPKERLDYWLSYFDRCIKCYGCRNSCPICFCKDCYLEPHKLIVKPGGNPPDKMFHLVRLMHVGDSCVNCGRCEASCPMSIPISRLYHALNKELSALFGYEPGLDLSSLPPLGMITEEDMKNLGVELD